MLPLKNVHNPKQGINFQSSVGKNYSQKHAVFEAIQNTALMTFFCCPSWRPLKKQHYQEESCLGQHSSCQLHLCTLWKGKRYFKRAGCAWSVVF